MPTETAIVIAGIVFVFAVFAISLAWAELLHARLSRAGIEALLDIRAAPPSCNVLAATNGRRTSFHEQDA